MKVFCGMFEERFKRITHNKIWYVYETMLYPVKNVNKIKNMIKWVTQKNIEDGENKGPKREEPKEKIKRNSIYSIL